MMTKRLGVIINGVTGRTRWIDVAAIKV